MYLEEYRKARQAGLKEAKRSQNRGCSPYLPVLDALYHIESVHILIDLNGIGNADVHMGLAQGNPLMAELRVLLHQREECLPVSP